MASATVGPAAGGRHRSLSSEAAKRRQRRLSGLWGGPERADGRLEWWAAAWAAASLLTLLGHSALLVEMDLNARWVCIFTRSAWSVPSVVTPKTVASASAALAGPDQAPGAAELRRLAGMKKFGGCVCAATAGDGAALASAPSSTDRRPTSAECGVRPSSALSSSCMGRGASTGARRECRGRGAARGAPRGRKIPAHSASRQQSRSSASTRRTRTHRALGGVRADDVQVSLNYVLYRNSFQISKRTPSTAQSQPRTSHESPTHTTHTHTHINTHTRHMTQCTRLDPFRRFTES